MVDLRPAKAEAQRLLPPGHPVRLALMQEPDFIPADTAQQKLETYIRLALAMRDTRK
jgi:hypothetical protein